MFGVYFVKDKMSIYHFSYSIVYWGKKKTRQKEVKETIIGVLFKP